MATVRVRVNVDTRAIDQVPMLPEVQADMDERAGRGLRTQQTLVPVLTGALKRSLTIRRTSTGGRQIGSFDKDYAEKVEVGWQLARRFVAAQPYLRPSIDSMR